MGDGVEFMAGGKIVAALPNVVLVAQSDALADFPEELADFVAAPRPCPRPAHLVPPPTVERRGQHSLDKPAPPAPPPMRSVSPAPRKAWFGSWAVGLCFGLVIGYGASLSHAGLW